MQIHENFYVFDEAILKYALDQNVKSTPIYADIQISDLYK